MNVYAQRQSNGLSVATSIIVEPTVGSGEGRWLPRMRNSHVQIPGRKEAAPIYLYCVQVVLRGYCSVKGGG